MLASSTPLLTSHIGGSPLRGCPWLRNRRFCWKRLDRRFGYQSDALKSKMNLWRELSLLASPNWTSSCLWEAQKWPRFRRWAGSHNLGANWILRRWIAARYPPTCKLSRTWASLVWSSQWRKAKFRSAPGMCDLDKPDWGVRKSERWVCNFRPITNLVPPNWTRKHLFADCSASCNLQQAQRDSIESLGWGRCQ